MKNFIHFTAKKLTSVKVKFLVFFVFVLIIPLIFLLHIFGEQFQNILIDKEQEYINSIVSNTTQQFAKILGEMDKLTVSIVASDAVRGVVNDNSKMPTHDWFMGYKTVINALSVLTGYSNAQYGITLLCADTRNYTMNAHYNNLLTINDTIVKQVIAKQGASVLIRQSLSSSQDLLTVGRSFYSNGEWSGVVLVDFPLNELANSLLTLSDNLPIIYIFDSNLNPLFISNDNQNISTELLNAISTNKETVTIDSEKYLVFNNKVYFSGISIVCLALEEAIFNESTKAIRQFTIWFYCIIILTLCGTFSLIYYFTRNISILNLSIAEFAKNPKTTSAIAIKGNDEVGQLAKAFESMREKICTLLLQKEIDEKKKSTLEFQALQAQINPHMIYNTLNTITSLAEMQNIENIREVSSSFAKLLKSISNISTEYITIKEEIDYLKSYIAIKKYSLFYEPQTILEVDEDVLECKILKLMLQPLIENSFVHGFQDFVEDAKLSLNIKKENDKIIICISDNGAGFDAEKLQLLLEKESSFNSNVLLSVGIKNVYDRLKLQYPSCSSFSITSSHKAGTKVFISFPAEN